MEEGFFTNDGKKVDPESIPMPALCFSCSKHDKEEIACTLTRMDQIEEIQNEEVLCCFAYEPIDPNIEKESIFNEMNSYLRNKYGS